MANEEDATLNRWNERMCPDVSAYRRSSYRILFLQALFLQTSLRGLSVKAIAL